VSEGDLVLTRHDCGREAGSKKRGAQPDVIVYTTPSRIQVSFAAAGQIAADDAPQHQLSLKVVF
jgi:hypothetical protein